MEYLDTVERWHFLVDTIRQLQAEERALREGLFAGTFPSPKEGTNKIVFPDGRILKGIHKLGRNFQKGIFDDHELVLGEGPTAQTGLPFEVWSELVRPKFELDKKKYNALTEEQRKGFDNILVIKPELPSLELVIPGENGNHLHDN